MAGRQSGVVEGGRGGVSVFNLGLIFFCGVLFMHSTVCHLFGTLDAEQSQTR